MDGKQVLRGRYAPFRHPWRAMDGSRERHTPSAGMRVVEHDSRAGASAAFEVQPAALPVRLAGPGNGDAQRAGYTYPSTWLGTLPQIAPLSGVPSSAPALHPPQAVRATRALFCQASTLRATASCPCTMQVCAG